jgi:hypothetical protein
MATLHFQQALAKIDLALHDELVRGLAAVDRQIKWNVENETALAIDDFVDLLCLFIANLARDTAPDAWLAACRSKMRIGAVMPPSSCPATLGRIKALAAHSFHVSKVPAAGPTAGGDDAIGHMQRANIAVSDVYHRETIMIDSQYDLGQLDHNQIQAWLEWALKGQKPLPRHTPDEPHHLGIVRLEMAQQPEIRRSLNMACNALLWQFCNDLQGETAYLQELLALTANFKTRESVPMLLGLVNQFPVLPAEELDFDIRNAVLAVLITGTPAQPVQFWHGLLQQDARYAARAISGALAYDKMQALALLPDMPNSAHSGAATKLKLNLAWGKLPAGQRAPFVEKIRHILPRCKPEFARPIWDWVDGKHATSVTPDVIRSKLAFALNHVLGMDVAPRNRRAKLHQPYQPDIKTA